jgi:DNA-binding NarL/FixJ family response regulator
MPIRLAIIDDAEVVVRGLAEMLRPFAEEVELRSLDSRQPLDHDLDVALVDVALHGRSAALHELVGHPRVRRVAVYSWNLDRRLVDEALQRGASAYLSKTANARDLVSALRRVHAGECVVDGHHGTFDGVHGADRVVDGRANGSSHSDAQDGWPGRDAGLTAREAEVIALITQGLSNQEIAQRASLSINSVKSYIRTSYRKMGVTSRTNAVLWGLEHGFSPDRVRIHPERDPV